MANEFIIKNGFQSRGDSQITGSLNVSSTLTVNGGEVGAAFPFTGDAQITGSLTISGSFSSFTLDSDNIVLGAGSGTSMEAGANSNIIVGSNTATSLTTGDFNVILGDSAGAADTNSQKNVLIGQRAGGNSTSLSENIFIGNGAGRYGSGLSGNVGIGQAALQGTTNNNGDYNVGIGWQSGLSIEDGEKNVFIGYRAAEDITTGNYNVVIGKKSGFTLTTGANNVFVGPDAGNGVSTGNRNIAIGYSASFSGDVSDQLIIGSGSLATISASLSTGDVILGNNVQIDGGGLSIKNKGAQSYARFYCESANAHYTELKAQPHALFSGNPVVLLPAYDFNFASPKFEANITASGNISASGTFIGDGSTLTNLQRPITTAAANFSASTANAGHYFRCGGNITCSIGTTSATSIAIGTEYEFFQTASAGNLLFETSSGVTFNSKDGNMKLAGQFSAATLKKVGTDEYDLIGDLG